MNPQNAKRRSTAIGLVILCLIPLLTSCASPPTLQTVYIATPLPGNDVLLCSQKRQHHRTRWTTASFGSTSWTCSTGLKERRAQQDEFQAEIERQKETNTEISMSTRRIALAVFWLLSASSPWDRHTRRTNRSLGIQ